MIRERRYEDPYALPTKDGHIRSYIEHILWGCTDPIWEFFNSIYSKNNNITQFNSDIINMKNWSPQEINIAVDTIYQIGSRTFNRMPLKQLLDLSISGLTYTHLDLQKIDDCNMFTHWTFYNSIGGSYANIVKRLNIPDTSGFIHAFLLAVASNLLQCEKFDISIPSTTFESLIEQSIREVLTTYIEVPIQKQYISWLNNPPLINI
jgi:hypothetical protein